MKKIFLSVYNQWLYLIFSVVLISHCAAAQTTCPVIPLPNHFSQVDETFLLSEHTPVIVKDTSLLTTARFLKNQLLRYTGVSLGEHGDGNPSIVLQKNPAQKGREGTYSLDMSSRQITISAGDDAGVFNGVVSVLQLALQAKNKAGTLPLQCWKLQDEPLYPWRGVMLDESRHFFGKAVVKEILDQMALLKLNRFHWHLTDQPGWRIQIRKYPLLTLVGGIGNHSDAFAPARYYTQDDIREIVAYARTRHITVIPEVDMPGHATAANRAYPEFSGGGTGRYADFTFNPGKEETYGYLNNILKEVSVLFPSGMIHLGGDEVSFGSASWAQDQGVRTLMNKQHLSDLKAVEQYFFKRMTDSALRRFDRVLAWDEATDADLPADSVIIFWWRHDKPEQLRKALTKGFDVVLCPRIPFYFDFVQDSTDRQGRRWKGVFSSLQQVYRFDAHAYEQTHGHENHLLGVQANLWTETVASKRRLEYLLFPRMEALAEAAWTSPEKRNYASFLSRLKPWLSRYREEGVYYYNPLEPARTPEAVDEY